MNSEYARASRADGSLPSGRRQPRHGRVRTSAVTNVPGADIGLPGRMGRVEAMKKRQMEPPIKIASRNVASLRLQLDGLASDRGAHVKKDFFAGVESKALEHLHLYWRARPSASADGVHVDSLCEECPARRRLSRGTLP
ncbi:MAG: hypothetical protein AB1832_14055 [Pseudomonadota bacterium]